MFFWVVARVLQENARGLYTKVMRVSRVCLRAGRILDQHFMPRRTFLLVQNNPCRTDPGDRSRAILVFSVQGGVISKDRGFDLGVLARSLVILTSPVGIKLHFWLPSPGLPQQRPRCWALARRFRVANLTMTLYSTFHAQGDVPSPSPKPRAGEYGVLRDALPLADQTSSGRT